MSYKSRDVSVESFIDDDDASDVILAALGYRSERMRCGLCDHFSRESVLGKAGVACCTLLKYVFVPVEEDGSCRHFVETIYKGDQAEF